jgi:hypothetical protein
MREEAAVNSKYNDERGMFSNKILFILFAFRHLAVARS